MAAVVLCGRLRHLLRASAQNLSRFFTHAAKAQTEVASVEVGSHGQRAVAARSSHQPQPAASISLMAPGPLFALKAALAVS